MESATLLTSYIGKEANRLLERATGEVTDPLDYRTTYTADRWRQLVLPVLRDIRDTRGTKHIGDQVGVSDRQVRNWMSERDEPHARNRRRAEQLAVDWARHQLAATGARIPADSAAALYAHQLILDI